MGKNRIKFDQYAKQIYELLEGNMQIEGNFIKNIHTIDLINKGLMLFEWKKVPETIVKRSIETRLFFKGKLVFFFDDRYGYQMLPFTYDGGINDDGQYTKVIPISLNGIDYGVKYINEDCVVVRDNEIEIPPLIYAVYFGDEISDLFNVRRKNNNWLKIPFVFKGTGNRDKDAKRALDVKSVMIDNDNEAFVFTDAFNDLSFFDLKPQYFGAEIEEQIKVMKNNYLEYLGIDHLNFDKKERMITSEVEIKEEENSLNLAKRYRTRKEAVSKINEIFGLDVSVECSVARVVDDNTTNMNIISSKVRLENKRG